MRTGAGIMLKAANLLYDNGDFASAAPAFELILQRDPSCHEARAHYAGCLVELGDRDNLLKAVDNCDRLVKELGLNASVLYTRAEAHFNLKNFEKASIDATLAISQDKSLVNAWCLRAACHNARARYKDAVDDLDKALKQRCAKELRGKMLLYRGVALFKLRNASDALRDLRSATSLDASLSATATAWINLASAQLEEDEKRADAAASALVLEDARIERKKKSRRQKRRNRKKNRQVVRVKQSLHNDLFNIEVAAIVDTVFAVSSARVLGNYKSDEIDEALALRMADNLQNQTRLGMVRMLHKEYVNEKIKRWFQEESQEQLSRDISKIFNQYQ